MPLKAQVLKCYRTGGGWLCFAQHNTAEARTTVKHLLANPTRWDRVGSGSSLLRSQPRSTSNPPRGSPAARGPFMALAPVRPAIYGGLVCLAQGAAAQGRPNVAVGVSLRK